MNFWAEGNLLVKFASFGWNQRRAFIALKFVPPNVACSKEGIQLMKVAIAGSIDGGVPYADAVKGRNTPSHGVIFISKK